MELWGKHNFEQLVHEYARSVYMFVYRMLGDSQDAEDVTQEVFVKVWKSIKTYDQDKRFKTWIFSIARNAAIDFLRKRKDLVFSTFDTEEESFEEHIKDPGPLPSEVFEQKERREELEKKLLELKPEVREIIVLHEMEELTFEEIGSLTGRSLNTVKSIYRRGMHQLQGLLRI